MRSVLIATFLVLFLVAAAQVARASDVPFAPPPPPDRPVVVQACTPCAPGGPWWAPRRFGVQAYLAGWLYRSNGTMAVRGVEQDVKQSFSDVVDVVQDYLDKILQGGVELRYGRWGLGFSGSFMRLADDGVGSPAGAPGASWDAEQFIGQVNLYYRFGATPLGCNPCSPCAPTLLYDVLVGVRWWDMDSHITVPNLGTFGGSRSWADPVVGGRIACDFRNGWVADIEGDIGGFGVSSDFTWRLRAGIQWWPTRWFGIGAGWLAVDDDYETGSGSDRFAWDVRLDGPYLSVGLRF